MTGDSLGLRQGSSAAAPDQDDEGGGPGAEAEPIATLRTFRTGALLGYRKKGWAKEVFFAQNVVLRGGGEELAVGNVVQPSFRWWCSRGVRGVHY
jgi:hypothetical protein